MRVFKSTIWRGAYIVHSSLVFARRFISARGIPAGIYRKWIRKYGAVTPQLRALMTRDIAAWPLRPFVSVILRSDNVEPERVQQAIESVRGQTYPYWELCISDDASTIEGVCPLLERYSIQDSRIHVVFRSEKGGISANSNTALDLVHSEYVALLDATDCLSEDALFWVAREIAIHPETDLLFSDEDSIDTKGKRLNPYFKSAWNPALMCCQNAFSHLGVYRRSLIEQIGRFREGFEGSQDYDLVLRCAEKTTRERIRHIPRVLYHSHAHICPSATKPHVKAGALAIEEHFTRQGVVAKVELGSGGYYQVDYRLAPEAPKVSILMPSACRLEVLRPCLTALLERSTYQNFEILLAVNEIRFSNPSQAAYLNKLKLDRRVRVLAYPDQPFNLAWVINWAAGHAKGSYFCLMNDDVEVITKDWLERLAARVALDGVGAAGPMLYYPSDEIQQAGVVLGIGGAADHAFKHRPRGYSGYFGRAALEQDFSCLTGACLLVRGELFNELGGFDEGLPMAFNDVDFCIKVRRTGARMVWVPSAELYHHESVSLGRHNSAQHRQQFSHDVGVLRTRWRDLLVNDPCYSPNLSLVPGSMFSLAWPPRVPKPKDILGALPLASISRTSELTSRNP